MKQCNELKDINDVPFCDLYEVSLPVCDGCTHHPDAKFDWNIV